MNPILKKLRDAGKRAAARAAETPLGRQVKRIPAPIRKGWLAGAMVPVPGGATAGALAGTGVWAKGAVESAVRRRTGQPYRMFGDAEGGMRSAAAESCLVELMRTYDGKDPGPGATVSPKLDGVYARATKDGVFSRSGKPLNVPHVSARLARHFRKHPDGELEGELWRKGLGIEKIAGAARAGGGAAKPLRMHVFPKDGQARPWPVGAVRRVPGKAAATAEDVQKVFQKALKRGHEGVVVRGADGGTAKLKPRQDAEWEVAAVHGGPRGVLALKDGAGGSFKVQSRPGVAAKPGDRVQVSHSGKTAKGRPKAAVAERVRNHHDFSIHTIMHTTHSSTPARAILGDAFFAQRVPSPARPYARVIELARGESPEEEIARDRRTLRRIAIGATLAGAAGATILHKGRIKPPAHLKVVPPPAVPNAVLAKVKKPLPSFWGPKRVKKTGLQANIEHRTLNIEHRKEESFEMTDNIILFQAEKRRDGLEKVRDVAIIGGAGGLGIGGLVAARQARRLGKKAENAIGYAGSAAARTAAQVRQTVTPKAIAQEGLTLVKKKLKAKAIEYFPTFTKAARLLRKPVKFFETPAQRLGVIDFAVASPPDPGKIRDKKKRFVDHWEVAAGLKRGYDKDGNKADVSIGDPVVMKSLYRKAGTLNKWGGRGGRMLKDTKDVVAGVPRARDASGRKKQREWDKPWAKDTAKKALLVGGGLAYTAGLKKSRWLKKQHVAVVRAGKSFIKDIRNGISGFQTPAREILLESDLELLDFTAKRKSGEPERPPSWAGLAGLMGAGLGAELGAGAGRLSAAGSKDAETYAKMLKPGGTSVMAPGGGGAKIAPRRPNPFRAKGKFGGAERLARGEVNALHKLRKTVRRRKIIGGVAGAAALGGLSYISKRMQEDKRFETPARRLGVIDFDAISADAGWDLRDPRGRSARVFAPGSRKRERREKEWGEKVENERKLWKGGILAAGLLAGGAGIAIGRKLPKRIHKPAADIAGSIIHFPRRQA